MARFVKGQSGNPGGRPKGLERIVNDTIRAMVEEVEDPETKQKVKLDGWEQISRKLFALAIDGNVAAAKLLFERAGGYPKANVKLDDARNAEASIDLKAMSTEDLRSALGAIATLKRVGGIADESADDAPTEH